jgi:hypothetical protein
MNGINIFFKHTCEQYMYAGGRRKIAFALAEEKSILIGIVGAGKTVICERNLRKNHRVTGTVRSRAVYIFICSIKTEEKLTYGHSCSSTEGMAQGF